MNRALRYFGGKKHYFIPFITLFGIYTFNYLQTAFLNCGYIIENSKYLSSADIIYYFSLYILGAIVLFAVVCLWLGFGKKVLIITLSLLALTALLNTVTYAILLFRYGVSFYNIISILVALLYYVACVSGVVFLRLKQYKEINNMPYMIASFAFMSNIIPLVIELIHFNVEYGNMGYTVFDISHRIVFDILPHLCLIAAFVFLWIPLNKFSICPKCRHRNTKSAGFCGKCGSKLN